MLTEATMVEVTLTVLGLPNLMQTYQHLALTNPILPQGNWKQTGEGGGDKFFLVQPCYQVSST